MTYTTGYFLGTLQVKHLKGTTRGPQQQHKHHPPAAKDNATTEPMAVSRNIILRFSTSQPGLPVKMAKWSRPIESSPQIWPAGGDARAVTQRDQSSHGNGCPEGSARQAAAHLLPPPRVFPSTVVRAPLTTCLIESPQVNLSAFSSIRLGERGGERHTKGVCVRVCARVCVCVCARVCVRECVCVSVSDRGRHTGT